MTRRAIHVFVAALAVLAIATAREAQGQTVSVRIRVEAGPASPIAGALVALLTSDRVIVEGLSSEHGTVTLVAPRGSYRVQVRRVGYRPFVSDVITLPQDRASSGNDVLLRVESERVVLHAMVVSAVAQCGRIAVGAETLSAVWDEVAKALQSSQLTTDDLRGILRMRTYRSELDARGEVISSDTTVLPVSHLRPFGAADPASLVTLGYVRGDRTNGWEYFAPDEAVLLSEDFAATHCFKVIRDAKAHAGEIGVAFSPVPKRKVADIRGVLWIDEKTSELRDVGFVFVNAGILDKFEAGGSAHFRRVASGAWLVNEWQLRMPLLASKMGEGDNLTVIGYVEKGGFIADGLHRFF